MEALAKISFQLSEGALPTVDSVGTLSLGTCTARELHVAVDDR